MQWYIAVPAKSAVRVLKYQLSKAGRALNAAFAGSEGRLRATKASVACVYTPRVNTDLLKHQKSTNWDLKVIISKVVDPKR